MLPKDLILKQRIPLSTDSSQVQVKRKPVNPTAFLTNIQSEALLKQSVATSTPTERVVLHTLLKFADQYPNIYPSQATIAKRSKRSLSTVKRVIARLEYKGLIVKVRDMMNPFDTCYYFLAPLLYTRTIRRMIAGIILSLSLLGSSSKTAPAANELLAKASWLFNNKTTRAYRGVRGERCHKKRKGERRMERPVLHEVGVALKLSPTQIEKLEKYPDERLQNVLMGYNERKKNIINGWGWFLNVITNGYVFKPANKNVATVQEKRVFNKTNVTAPQHTTTVKPKTTAELKAEQKLKEQQAPQKRVERESNEIAIQSTIDCLRGNAQKIAGFVRFAGIPKEWNALSEEQQAQFLTNDPWFAEVVGRGSEKDFWQQKHDRLLDEQRYEESFTQHSFEENSNENISH